MLALGGGNLQAVALRLDVEDVGYFENGFFVAVQHNGFLRKGMEGSRVVCFDLQKAIFSINALLSPFRIRFS